MSLDGSDLKALAHLLEQALDLPTDEARVNWLEGLDASHLRLRPVLRNLLERHSSPNNSSILDTFPKFEITDDEAGYAGSVADFAAMDAIGPYRLIREIGHGGMSVVWLAEPIEGQLQRPVALKLPLVALNRSRLARHFARERDILATLTHPRIARLYDAGISEAGQPYLAMEFVEGTPILEHCDRLKLGVRERIVLFEQVLSAVQYAHSHLVVHRDLKPSNILVTAQNDVVLLDFGIAKLLGDGASQDTELTLFAGRAFTPDYASPEQIAGKALGITTDIYSLGVVLYELLAGSRPYRLKRNSLGALEEAILDLDAPLPSRLVTVAAAQLRSCSPGQLARALRGDLDTILLKTLGKRPDSRYPTADALLQELQRYCRGQPIQARAARPWYHAKKFLTRNKLAVSLVAALLVALMAGLGTALWEAHAARVEARRAASVKSFLVGVFTQSDPEHARGKNITAGEILERGAARLDSELRSEPEMLGELHGTISDIYSSLGANVEALAHAERAIALLEKAGRQSSPDYINALWQRAQSIEEEEKWSESVIAYEQLRHASHSRSAADNEWDAVALRGLAWAATEQGQVERAEQLYAQALDIARRVAGERSVLYLKTLGSSITADLDLGLLEQARAAVTKAIALSPQVAGFDVTDQLVNRYALASILFRERKYSQSLEVLNRLVPEMDQHIGPRHDRTIKARALLAQELAETGDFTRAIAEEQANLETATAAHSGDPEQLALQELTMAKILRAAGNFDAGVSHARKGLAYLDAKYSAPTFLRERGRWILGDLLARSGHVKDGIDTLLLAVTNLKRLPGGAAGAAVADALMSLSKAYRLQGDESAAATNLASACQIYDEVLGPDSPTAVQCHRQ
jgi:serine/threonine-protein kinase